MTNISIVENKISSIKKYLKILENYKNYSQKEIIDDINLRGAVERYLYLACQSAIDLAESVISYKDLRKPATTKEAFSILEEEKIINKNLSENLMNMVGFRNIVAHDYEKINYDILYDVLKNKLEDIEEFAKIIKSIK